MASSTTIRRVADDKKTGLTVAEIEDWLEEVRHAGIDMLANPHVISGIQGQVKSIGVTG